MDQDRRHGNVIKLEDLMPAVAAQAARERQTAPAGDPEREARVREQSVARARVEAIKRVPPAYAGATMDAAWLADLVGHPDLSRAWEARSEAHVAFLGPPGSGKSSLAAAMFKAAAAACSDTRKLGRFMWLSSHKLAKARAGQPLGEGEAPIVEAALGASMMVLDELGGEDPRYASAVAEVLYERYEQALPTWVTTGVGSKEIATRYGGGIARRVFEGATVFRLAGPK